MQYDIYIANICRIKKLPQDGSLQTISKLIMLSGHVSHKHVINFNKIEESEYLK